MPGSSELLTGDAEWEAESAMLAGGWDLMAEVLKVGPHGSNTSTYSAFLNAVQPEAAIISVWEGQDASEEKQEYVGGIQNRRVQVSLSEKRMRPEKGQDSKSLAKAALDNVTSSATCPSTIRPVLWPTSQLECQMPRDPLWASLGWQVHDTQGAEVTRTSGQAGLQGRPHTGAPAGPWER